MHVVSEFWLSLRLISKAPGFAATVIAVFALGVGANTAIFSVIHAVMLNPFPYADANRIVMIGSSREGSGQTSVTYPDFLDIREQVQRFEQVAYATNRTLTLTGGSEPVSLTGAAISASAWPLLGLEPMLGRTFTAEEDHPGAAPVAVLGASLWRGRFGADPAILGRQLMLEGRAYTIIGVMPPRFKFWGAEVWIPIGLQADTELMRSRVLRMNNWMVGKMRPGVSLDDAQAELDVITRRLAEQYPESNRGIGAFVALLSSSVTGPVQGPLFLLLGAVGFVLLIACANIANLLLARSATREREYAIRSALGASRGRLMAQMLIETLPLALIGSVAGVLLGAWGLDTLLALLPPNAIPAEAEVSVNLQVMLITLAVCVGTMLLFALMPAVALSRTQFSHAMQEGGRGSAGPSGGWMRSALIVAEVALSMVLLVGAGLLLRSFSRLQAVDPGFAPENLFVMSVQLPESRYGNGEQGTAFFRQLVEEVRRLPGVKHAGAASNAPFLNGSDMPLITADRTYDNILDLQGVQFSLVLGDYFAAQGLRLLAGRTFTEADTATAEPVIILNEETVKRYLPAGVDPLTQRVMLGVPDNLITPGMLPVGMDRFVWSRVVGVVASTRHYSLYTDPVASVFVPVDQAWNVPFVRNSMFVLLRMQGEATSAAADARAVVRKIDPNQPVGMVSDMETVIAETLRPSRFTTVLLGTFAGVACLLAVVGIYGVVAWNVAQRTRELGIRAALGAGPAEVLRLVVRQSMRVVVLGVLLGMAGALALTRILGRMLFETSPLDPWTFAAVALLLTTAAFLACLIPAARATRISPLEALRSD